MTPIEEKVCALLVEEYGLDQTRVTLEAEVKSDLGLDSLDEVELVMACEKEFDIDIPDAEAAELRTVGDYARCVAARAPVGHA